MKLRSGLLIVSLVAVTGTAFGQKPKLKDIYPPTEVAPAELKAALAKAKKSHKRVILDFGGNWCGDCRALDKYFHDPLNADLLKQNFILVDINVGKIDKNLDIAAKYEIPLSKGVPALAVLESDGTLLFSQKLGEFESMRKLSPGDLNAFLKKWSPASSNGH